MSRLSAALLTLVALALPAVVLPVPVDPSWTYADQAAWVSESSQCQPGAPGQSPVALTPFTDLFWDDDDERPELMFASDLQNGTLTASNTGRTLKVTLKGGDGQPAVRLQSDSSEPLKGTYILDHLHLHWNDPAGGRGSEHQMNGLFEQAEAHFVFYNQLYGSVSASLDKPDGLTVIGMLLRPSVLPDFPTFNLAGDLASLASLGSYVSRQQNLLNLRPLLQSAMFSIFSYSGSLTTPPCSPVVRWMVASRPFTIDATFLQQLRTTLYANVAGTEILQNNWRILQALGSRVINRYREE